MYSIHQDQDRYNFLGIFDPMEPTVFVMYALWVYSFERVLSLRSCFSRNENGHEIISLPVSFLNQLDTTATPRLLATHTYERTSEVGAAPGPLNL